MRRVALRLLAIVALALFASGCGSVETYQAMLRAPTPPTGARVELYLAQQQIPRPYYDVALLQAVGTGNKASAEAVVRALSNHASRLGCDAVVRMVVDMGYSRVHGAGVCVKWLGGPNARPNLVPRNDPTQQVSPSAPPAGPDSSPKDTMRHNDGF